MIQDEVLKAVDALEKGQTVLYPTDTVWGVGCDAENADAVKEVLKVKNSPSEKSLIILIADSDQLYRYVHKVPDLAWELIEFSEKPLTVVYPNGKNVAPALLAEDGSIAIRIVKDDFCRNVIKKLGRAITSTSANLSGEPAPKKFADISGVVKERVNHIVNYRQTDKKFLPPSTIVKVGFDGEVKFLRK